MRHLIATTIIAIAALALTAGTALADSGQYTASGGEFCTWSGYGSSIDLQCSGYSLSAGGYVNYNCSIFSYGYGSSSWTCRSISGATWSGSR